MGRSCSSTTSRPPEAAASVRPVSTHWTASSSGWARCKVTPSISTSYAVLIIGHSAGTDYGCPAQTARNPLSLLKNPGKSLIQSPGSMPEIFIPSLSPQDGEELSPGLRPGRALRLARRASAPRAEPQKRVHTYSTFFCHASRCAPVGYALREVVRRGDRGRTDNYRWREGRLRGQNRHSAWLVFAVTN